MNLRSRFVQELGFTDAFGSLHLLPSRAAGAAQVTLGLHGAGIAITHSLTHLPVAATGECAATAEQLQTTLGHGPCLAAAATGRPRCSNENELRSEWPIYHAHLVEKTGFRSTLSVPLTQANGAVFAVLDGWCRSPVLQLRHSLDDIQSEIGELVAMMLLVTLDAGQRLPGWPPVELRRRQKVWIAVGMTLEAAGLDELSALAILRAYAFRHDLLLDDVAAAMVDHGRLTAEEVLGEL